MVATHLPEIKGRETRSVLAEALIAVFERWRVANGPQRKSPRTDKRRRTQAW